MATLSHRITSLAESQTIAMSKKSRELTEQGHKVINLSLGEPDFNTPKPIKEAAKQAIDDDYSHYTPVSGYRDLLEAVSFKLKRDNNLDYQPNQIVVSTGAKQSLINVILCLINPGDEVLVPSPYWVSYIEMIKLAGGIPKLLTTNIQNDFKIQPGQISTAMGPNTKMMLLNSPNNPTGTVYSQVELSMLAEEIRQHPELIVVSDEIYEHIWFTHKHESIAQFNFLKDQVVVINGMSKAFAMTGWRVGYMAGPEWIARACDKMQGQFTSATCSIAQRAALAGLELDSAIIEPMRNTFKRRRDLVLKKMNQIANIQSNIPEGAFYVFPNISAFLNKRSDTYGRITNSSDLCMYLLNEFHTAVVPGIAFGSDDYIRISFAASDENLITGLGKMQEALEKLQ